MFLSWGMKLLLRNNQEKRKEQFPERTEVQESHNRNGKKGEQSNPCVKGGRSPVTVVFLKEK